MAETESEAVEIRLAKIESQLSGMAKDQKSHGEVLTEIVGLVRRAAPLLESRAAQFALRGPASVLDHLKGARRG